MSSQESGGGVGKAGDIVALVDVELSFSRGIRARASGLCAFLTLGDN